jgi:CelD/BcsL family acetyltransferase involved in cellulose biosynthesis
MTLNVERLTYAEAFGTLRSEWEALDAELYPRTPFTSPMWNQHWWNYFARKGLLRYDEFFLHALRDDTGRLVAVVPLMRTYEPSFGPLRLCKLQFFGTDPSITEIRGIVCPVERQGEVVNALIDYFKVNNNNWSLFKWSGIRLDGEAHKNFGGTDYVRTERILPDYVISLPRSWDEFKSKLSNNTRKSLRKGYEFIDRDGHKVSFVVTERRDELDDPLELFFKLHKARSMSADMKSHRDSFAQRKHRNFLRDIVEGMGDRDVLRFFQLEINGKIIASRVAFALDGELYLYFSGFDPAWKKYGVMTTLMVEIIKWAIERGFSLINLSTGTDQSKLRWKPTEIALQDVVQSSPSLHGQLALRSELWLRRCARGEVTG